MEQPIKSIPLGKLYKFILANRGDSTFVDWTKEEIQKELFRHIEKGTLIPSFEEVCCHADIDTGNKIIGHKIYGIILYDVNAENKTLHINHIVCVHKNAFKHFLEIYKERYDGYTIQAFRRGNFTRYTNTAKLIRRLTNKLFYV